MRLKKPIRKILSFIFALSLCLTLIQGNVIFSHAADYSYDPSINTATVDADGNVTVTISIGCDGLTVYGYGLCLFATEPSRYGNGKLQDSGDLHFNSSDCKHVFYQEAANGGDSDSDMHNVTLTFSSNSKDKTVNSNKDIINRYTEGDAEDKSLYERLLEGNNGQPWHIVIGVKHSYPDTNCDYYLGTTASVFGTIPTASSSTTSVASIGDTSYNSFAEAVAAAQSGDTISLLENATISDKITLPAGITIQGNNHSVTRFGGDVFEIASGAPVTIKNLTISNSGRALSVPSGSTAILESSAITGCSSNLSAAIKMSGTVVLDRTTISDNVSTASNSGGVIEMGSGSILYGIESTIKDNVAQQHTGGINNYSGTVYMMKCRVTGNSSTGSSYASSLGGGIRTGSNFYAANCVIAGNKSGAGASDTLDIGGNPTLKNSIYGNIGGTNNIAGGSTGNDGNAAFPTANTQYSYSVTGGQLSVTMKYDDNGTLKSLLPTTDPVLSQTPSASSEDEITYTGSPIALVSGGTANGGTVVYAVGTSATTAPDSTAFTSDIPSRTESGTYYVWYMVKGDDTHNDTEPVCITVTIGETSEEGEVSVADEREEGNFAAAGLANSVDEVKQLVLTDDDRNAIAAGKEVAVWLEMNDTSDTVSDQDKESIEEKVLEELGEEYGVVCFLDVSLWKQVTGESAARVTDVPNGKVKVSLTVPESFRKEGATYKVACIHNGVVTILNATYDPTTYELTFETDEFSTYALVRADAETTETETTETEVTEPEVIEAVDWLEPDRVKLHVAAAIGGAQTVTIDGGYALPYEFMLYLSEHPDITLVYKAIYENEEITVVIPGSVAIADPEIPWYGPAYLKGMYGNGALPQANVKSGVYIVKKDDCLNMIAKMFGTTVDALVEKNNIKNRDLIYPGQEIMY